ncbi:hypothetical protein D3C76_663150 [compost metagenome]
MADAADFAGPLVQNWTDELIAAIRERALSGPSAAVCVDCGDDIPVERRLAALGCVRCVECQGFADRRGA